MRAEIQAIWDRLKSTMAIERDRGHIGDRPPVRRRTAPISLRVVRRARDFFFCRPGSSVFSRFTVIPMLATLGFSFTNLNLIRRNHFD